MNYTFGLTEDFELDLWEIEFYLRTNESEKRSDKVLNSIKKTIESIVFNPRHFPRHEYSFGQSEVRKAVHHGTYIIVYEVKSQHINFLKIFHGSRDVKV